MSRPDASRLAAGITAAARAGDRKGVAAVLERSGPLAADAVTHALAVSESASQAAAWREWRRSCDEYRADAAATYWAGLSERLEAARPLIRDVVRILADAMLERNPYVRNR